VPVDGKMTAIPRLISRGLIEAPHRSRSVIRV
jgi:hypothetical protein